MVRYDRSTADKGAKYVEDRRGAGGRVRGRGGMAAGGLAGGGAGVAILVLLLNMCTGGSGFALDTQTPFDGSGGAVDASPATTTQPSEGAPDDLLACSDDTVTCMQFLMFDIQDTWDRYFEQAGQVYEPTSLVIFEDVVDTGCGQATSAVGPFYCPAPGDNKVYVDLGFYDELSRQFGAPGDFAQSYVIAHEIGHHVQNITGISDAIRSAQSQDPGSRNEYSVRQELQADCLAGVWAYSVNQRETELTGVSVIEPGDIREGLVAAASVGDDRIQAQAGMSVDQESWTHGSADQRQKWFTVGFETGDPEQCDTFAVDNP